MSYTKESSELELYQVVVSISFRRHLFINSFLEFVILIHRTNKKIDCLSPSHCLVYEHSFSVEFLSSLFVDAVVVSTSGTLLGTGTVKSRGHDID